MAEYLDLQPGLRLLEPSAGTGALAQAVRDEEPTTSIECVEICPPLAEWLRKHVGKTRCADFLECLPDAEFDRVAMNPPFDRGADIKHVQHALRFLKPGGTLVAVVADGPRQAEAFRSFEDLERLAAGTFEGTKVRSRVIRQIVPVTKTSMG